MELIHVGPGERAYFKKLYHSSFPKNERKPFRLLLWYARTGRIDTFLIREKGENLGLTVAAGYKDLVLIYYFAIDPKHRGTGIGSRVIPLWQETYPEKRIFLEIEIPDEHAPNGRDRFRRKNFYLRNGLRETGLFVRLFGVPMEVLSLTGSLSFSEYQSLYRHLFGPLSRLVQPLSGGDKKKIFKK